MFIRSLAMPDGSTIFSWHPWMLWLVVAASLMLALKTRKATYKEVYQFSALGLVLWAAPKLYTQQLIIAPQHAYQNSGFWLDSIQYDLPFDKLAQLRLVSEKAPYVGWLTGLKADYLIAYARDGSQQRIALIGLPAKGYKAIMEAARAAKLETVDARGTAEAPQQQPADQVPPVTP